MAEGQTQSSAHLAGGAGLQEEGGANQVSAYCKELLMRGGEEFSFEELRAERLNLRTQQQLDERLRRLAQVKEQLSQELEYKRKMLLLRRSQQAQSDSASSFTVYDESAAARPAGKSPNELHDDVFLRPDERRSVLQVQHPPPDHQRGTAEDLRTQVVSQKPANKPREKLSPIEETSSLSAGDCSPLQEDMDQDQDMNQVQDQDQAAGGGPVDPCDPDLRRRLLDLSDVTSSPDFHSESRPLPAVEERASVQLGGVSFLVYCRVLQRGSVSVYRGVSVSSERSVVLSVDGGRVPWDFHQFLRLKRSSPDPDRLPQVSCFLFQDGCITLYTSPPRHAFTEVCVSSEASAACKAVSLLQLVSQLQSCRLLHLDLHPQVLTCCPSGSRPLPDWVFPVDWSSSVDLDLQEVTEVQQLPSAQNYISQGLLAPGAPPHLVDLVGLAETVHLLLTGRQLVAVRDGAGWAAERFDRAEPSEASLSEDVWAAFFRSLLNAGGRSPESVLSELTQQLSELYL
ncbi:uncharacterized protein bub1ba [Centropristis striata]|uniref:uncharacterized protein bub1ba n=1 Tax=Centropristis striata TaxID=184440 RepID=UPI0027DEE80B|nr:uncharacterized protein bub1ba [Centropristis striata]